MAIAVPDRLSNYTQDYGYGTQHKDGEKTGIFLAWFFLVLLVARAINTFHVLSVARATMVELQ